MKTAWCVLGSCLLLMQPVLAQSDVCGSLQAAITKAAALRGEMQREAAPLLNTAQMPARHEGACNAAQVFRDHIVILAKLPYEKCLNEEQQQDLTATLVSSMKEANNNIGLFCH